MKEDIGIQIYFSLWPLNTQIATETIQHYSSVHLPFLLKLQCVHECVQVLSFVFLFNRLSHSERLMSEQRSALERQAHDRIRELEVILPYLHCSMNTPFKHDTSEAA